MRVRRGNDVDRAASFLEVLLCCAVVCGKVGSRWADGGFGPYDVYTFVCLLGYHLPSHVESGNNE